MTNIADLLVREDKGKAGGVAVKKHIVRYNRPPANAATSSPSAPAPAPAATLIHAAMTEVRRQMSLSLKGPIVSSDQLDSALMLK